jgi:hypothetical protein
LELYDDAGYDDADCDEFQQEGINKISSCSEADSDKFYYEKKC